MDTRLATESTPSRCQDRSRSFVAALVSLLRADNAYGALDGKTDAQLLSPYLLARAARRALPMFGDPDASTLRRVEQFYQAVGIAVERRTGLVASPLVSLHREGFGRVAVITGKLVAYSKSLRDVHRFGFEDIEALSGEGETIVALAIATIEAHIDVARD